MIAKNTVSLLTLIGAMLQKKPKRVSDEDAHKDVPCEFVEEMKGADDG